MKRQVLPTKAIPNKSKLADFSYKVPDEINSGKQLPLVGKTAGYEYEYIIILGYPATSNIPRDQLKAELSFKSANIFDDNGKLTLKALENSRVLKLSDGVIKNPEIVRILTRDGSKIEDWQKMTTESINVYNGQSMQIHFYRNIKTGKIDYETRDFKIKGEVDNFKIKIPELNKK